MIKKRRNYRQTVGILGIYTVSETRKPDPSLYKLEELHSMTHHHCTHKATCQEPVELQGKLELGSIMGPTPYSPTLMPKPNVMVIHAVVDREGRKRGLQGAHSPGVDGVDEWTLNEWWRGSTYSTEKGLGTEQREYWK